MRFELRLSRALGMTWREWKSKVFEDERWMQVVFERVEPLEDGWVQSAQLISFLANSFPGKGKGFKLGDVYPHLKPEVPSSDEGAFVLAATTFAKALNAKAES